VPALLSAAAVVAVLARGVVVVFLSDHRVAEEGR